MFILSQLVRERPGRQESVTGEAEIDAGEPGNDIGEAGNDADETGSAAGRGTIPEMRICKKMMQKAIIANRVGKPDVYSIADGLRLAYRQAGMSSF